MTLGFFIIVCAAALLYACAAIIATLLAGLIIPRLPTLAQSPPARVLPIWLLPAIYAIVGIAVLLGHASVEQLGVIALLCIPLGSIVLVDMAKGLIPDLLTVLPMAVLLVWNGLHGPWLPMLVGAAVPFAAFALSAAFSKGRGMGWGDAKLAAFGGAILGLAPSLIAFALASLVAVMVAMIAKRAVTEPIAFGPYMVAAIIVGMLVQAHH